MEEGGRGVGGRGSGLCAADARRVVVGGGVRVLVLVFVLAFVRHSSTNNWNQPTEEAARRTAHRYAPRNHVCARLHTTSQVEESHEGRLRMIGLGLDAVRSQSSSRSTAYMPTTLGRG